MRTLWVYLFLILFSSQTLAATVLSCPPHSMSNDASPMAKMDSSGGHAMNHAGHHDMKGQDASHENHKNCCQSNVCASSACAPAAMMAASLPVIVDAVSMRSDVPGEQVVVPLSPYSNLFRPPISA